MQKMGQVPFSKPARTPWLHIDAGWRTASRSYYQHHTICKTCQSAGQGLGERCTIGHTLWAAYESALERTPS